MSTSTREASLIAADTTVVGGVTADGELHVDGIIRGDVKVTQVFIGEAGQIEGSVNAESVEARGQVVGSITAKHVRLLATSRMDGDVTHESLTVEAGADFQGRSLRLERPSSRGLAAITGGAKGSDAKAATGVRA